MEAKKAQGHQLGKPENLTEQARLKGIEVRQRNARNSQENRQAMDIVKSAKEKGISFRDIVNKLNDLGYRTRRGKEFGVSSVRKL